MKTAKCCKCRNNLKISYLEPEQKKGEDMGLMEMIRQSSIISGKNLKPDVKFKGTMIKILNQENNKTEFFLICSNCQRQGIDKLEIQKNKNKFSHINNGRYEFYA